MQFTCEKAVIEFEKQRMTGWRYTFIYLSILPLGLLISLPAFYFHASAILGYSPTYNHPDPKDISIYKFYAPIIYGSSVVSLTSNLIWIIALIVYLFSVKKENLVKLIYISSLTQTASFTLYFIGMFDWFVD
jgi:hypothetical protein